MPGKHDILKSRTTNWQQLVANTCGLNKHNKSWGDASLGKRAHLSLDPQNPHEARCMPVYLQDRIWRKENVWKLSG